MKYLIHIIRAGMLLTAALAVAGAEPSPCADCHAGVAEQLSLTSHGMPGAGTPSCRDCHGEGKAHMEEGDPALIKLPAGEKSEKACRSCHESESHLSFASGAVHAAADVFCGDCHSIHHSGNHEKLLSNAPNRLCASCHAAETASFKRPYGHRIESASVRCVSCHNPHGGRGERNLVTDRSGQGPCVTCHAEKRGPFVYPHVEGISGDCVSCHEPHGSTNVAALRRPRADQLCLECHSPITGGITGSQPPATHDVRYPKWRNCTVCHVAVHGSNSSPALLR